MASIKNQIADYAVGTSCLSFATGLPSGLTVRRGNLIPSTAARQPEILVYVGPELRWDPVGMRSRGNPIFRTFRLILEIRENANVNEFLDEMLDPLEVWAETRLFADQTFGGLASGIVDARFPAAQRGIQSDLGYLVSECYVDVEFTTQRGLPATRGDG